MTNVKQTVAGIRTQQLGSLVGFDAIVAAVGTLNPSLRFFCITSVRPVADTECYCLGHTADHEQIALIEQAKRDGVKRFVPSEFGVDHRSSPFAFFDGKRNIAKIVQEAAFPDGMRLQTSLAIFFEACKIP